MRLCKMITGNGLFGYLVRAERKIRRCQRRKPVCRQLNTDGSLVAGAFYRTAAVGCLRDRSHSQRSRCASACTSHFKCSQANSRPPKLNSLPLAFNQEMCPCLPVTKITLWWAHMKSHVSSSPLTAVAGGNQVNCERVHFLQRIAADWTPNGIRFSLTANHCRREKRKSAPDIDQLLVLRGHSSRSREDEDRDQWPLRFFSSHESKCLFMCCGCHQ